MPAIIRYPSGCLGQSTFKGSPNSALGSRVEETLSQQQPPATYRTVDPVKLWQEVSDEYYALSSTLCVLASVCFTMRSKLISPRVQHSEELMHDRIGQRGFFIDSVKNL